MVAEGLAEQASKPCLVACSDALLLIKNGGRHIVLDDSNQILEEYMDSGLLRKEPRGPGAEFLLWLITNQWNTQACSRIALSVGPDGQTTNFPNDASLASFDRDDRKFVCSALSHPSRPPILVSVDTDWLNAEADLARNGVVVEKLCPDDLQRLAAGKKAKRHVRRR